MSKVGEDITQMVFQRSGKGYISLGIQLRLHLCGDVRHQLQLVIHLRLLTAIAHILINHRASHEYRQYGGTHNDSAYDSFKFQLSIFRSYLQSVTPVR